MAMHVARRLWVQTKNLALRANSYARRAIIFVLSTPLWFRAASLTLSWFVSLFAVLFTLHVHPVLQLLISLVAAAAVVFVLGHAFSVLFPVEKRVQLVGRSLDWEPHNQKFLFLAGQYSKWLRTLLDDFNVLPSAEQLRDGLAKLNFDYHDNVSQARSLIRGLRNREFVRMKETSASRGRRLQLLVEHVSDTMSVDRQVIKALLGGRIGFNLEVLNQMLTVFGEARHCLETRVPSEAAWLQGQLEHSAPEVPPSADITSGQHPFNSQLKHLGDIVDHYPNRIAAILRIVAEPSTGRAAKLLAEMLHTVRDLDERAFLLKMASCRRGYPLGRLLGFSDDGKMWHDLQLPDKRSESEFAATQQGLRTMLRESQETVDRVVANFLRHTENEIVQGRKGSSRTIVIALTYGYSAMLLAVLKGLLQRYEAEDFNLVLVEGSKSSTDEELLVNELESSLGRRINHSIIPADGLKDRGVEIDKVFVGIEAINTRGHLVHPRGSTNVISEIVSLGGNVKVYAFGESYKVQRFGVETLDHTKMCVVKPQRLDCVITDCGVHERSGEDFQLDCCLKSWNARVSASGSAPSRP